MSAVHVPVRPITQRGAATLIVVMVLFFIVSLVAAYASRNLIFEQKTSSNQMRSSQAYEAAEAGVEWTLSQLNTGRATSACVPSTTLADQALRERYLDTNATSGQIAARTASGGGSVQPSCVFDTSDANPANWRWNCRCPAIDAASAGLAAPTTSTPAPAFALRFCQQAAGACNGGPAPRPGVIYLQVHGCTRLDANCLAFDGAGGGLARGEISEGAGTAIAALALRSALAAPPTAAVTLRGRLLDPAGGAIVGINNAEPRAQGTTVHAGLDVSASPTFGSLPGTPGEASIVANDPALVPADLVALGLPSADRFFVATFGMRPETYRRQPATIDVDCAVACTAAAVNAILDVNPGRMLWLRGAGGLTIDGNIGSAAAPALIVVEGNVGTSGAFTYTGVLYGRNVNWTWSTVGSTTVIGAVLGEGDLQFSGVGNITVTYDAPVLDRLRARYGSFVRVPGGWLDFRSS
jgi:type II secretory pathway pseudopilin PulG